MNEYKAYWLTDFPPIINWGVPRNNYGDLSKKAKAASSNAPMEVLSAL